MRRAILLDTNQRCYVYRRRIYPETSGAGRREGASRREEARMSGNHNALQIRLSCPLFPHGKHMGAFKLPLAFYPEHSSIQGT